MKRYRHQLWERRSAQFTPPPASAKTPPLFITPPSTSRTETRVWRPNPAPLTVNIPLCSVRAKTTVPSSHCHQETLSTQMLRSNIRAAILNFTNTVCAQIVIVSAFVCLEKTIFDVWAMVYLSIVVTFLFEQAEWRWFFVTVVYVFISTLITRVFGE